MYVYYLLSTIICLEKTDMRWFQDYRYEVPSSEPRIVCIFVVMTLLRLISFVYIMTEVGHFDTRYACLWPLRFDL